VCKNILSLGTVVGTLQEALNRGWTWLGRLNEKTRGIGGKEAPQRSFLCRPRNWYNKSLKLVGRGQLRPVQRFEAHNLSWWLDVRKRQGKGIRIRSGGTPEKMAKGGYSRSSPSQSRWSIRLGLVLCLPKSSLS
jgi:hypothetical protein